MDSAGIHGTRRPEAFPHSKPLTVIFFHFFAILLEYFQKNKRSVQQLVKYMFDVAMGMHYISERGLVHRVSSPK